MEIYLPTHAAKMISSRLKNSKNPLTLSRLPSDKPTLTKIGNHYSLIAKYNVSGPEEMLSQLDDSCTGIRVNSGVYNLKTAQITDKSIRNKLLFFNEETYKSFSDRAYPDVLKFLSVSQDEVERMTSSDFRPDIRRVPFVEFISSANVLVKEYTNHKHETYFAGSSALAAFNFVSGNLSNNPKTNYWTDFLSRQHIPNDCDNLIDLILNDDGIDPEVKDEFNECAVRGYIDINSASDLIDTLESFYLKSGKPTMSGYSSLVSGSIGDQVEIVGEYVSYSHHVDNFGKSLYELVIRDSTEAKFIVRMASERRVNVPDLIYANKHTDDGVRIKVIGAVVDYQEEFKLTSSIVSPASTIVSPVHIGISDAHGYDINLNKKTGTSKSVVSLNRNAFN